MRLQIHIRDDLAQVLNELASREKRWPKQQVEYLLQQALEQTAREGHPRAHPKEVSRAAE